MGLWGLKEGNDPKTAWLLELQKRLRRQDPPLEFEGAYGLPPPTDKRSFEYALRMLRGFVGTQQTEVRVFPALAVLEDGSEGLPTAAPGVGMLLATFSDHKRVLVGCATKTKSVRVDSGIAIVWDTAYETFELWYSRHVTRVGTKLRLDSEEHVEEDVRRAMTGEHPSGGAPTSASRSA